MIALLAALQRTLFGHSLAALHVLPAVAGATIVVLCGLLARELGGGRLAQGVAALSALVAPAFVGADSLFTMDAFDELWWTLAAYVLVRILAAHDPGTPVRPGHGNRTARLWLLFGLVAGLGLLTKLTILAFGLAVAVGPAPDPGALRAAHPLALPRRAAWPGLPAAVCRLANRARVGHPHLLA